MSDLVATSSAVDLSRLPAPIMIEQLTYEAIRDRNLALAQSGDEGFNALVASDPGVKLVEIFSYVEFLLRQNFNDRTRAQLTAYAKRADLDQVALRVGVFRQLISEGDPENGVEAVYEDDESLRQRIVLAPESFTCAGPELAYVYHAKSAHADVLDASATSPRPDDIKALVLAVLEANDADPVLVTAMQTALDTAVWPGSIHVSLLSRTGDGTAPEETIDAVAAVLTPVAGNRIRPMGDLVTVASANVIEFVISAIIYTFAGPDQSVVLEAARAKLDAYLAESRRLGRNITDSGVKAALTVPGVQRVVLTGWEDVVCDATQAAWCTGIELTHGGYDD